MNANEDEIRALAHRLWQEDGCPDGRASEHWRRAEERLSTSGPSSPADAVPAAGPHAKPELTNEDATPGTGMLPDPQSRDPNQQPSG